MNISLIVAMAENGVIGRDGEIPWRLRGDLRRFRELTVGGGYNSIVMGRLTHESIGRILDHRHNIVLTTRPDYVSPDVEDPRQLHLASSLSEAVQLAQSLGSPECFVIGGARVYEQALSMAGSLYVTRVHSDVPGDVYFPAWDEAGWDLVHTGSDIQEADLTYHYELYRRSTDG